jgi:hypothetical protein
VGWLLAIALTLTLYRVDQIRAPLAGMHSNDFKHLWIGSRLVHLGQSPYDESTLFLMAESHGLGGINPYVYLPFTGLVMEPVSQWSFPAAVRAWFWINQVALLLALVAAAIHVTSGRCWWMGGWLMAVGVLVASQMMPLHRQMTAGQLNCALALAFVVILVAVERRWMWLAGGAIAFATLFKLSPGLFVLYLLWKRAWRLLGWTALWLAILMAWSLWQVGLDIHLQFFPLLADMRVGHSTWEHHGMAFHSDPFNQSMGAFLLHALAGESDTQPWVDLGPGVANPLTSIFALSVLLTLIAVTRRGWGAAGPGPATWRAEWTLIVIASLLIPSLCWDHYVVQLLPVLIVTLWGTLRIPGRGSMACLLVSALWAAAAFLLVIWVPHSVEPLRHGLGLIGMSLRLWGILLLFGLCLWWRARAGQRDMALDTSSTDKENTSHE